ncbi:hypothetical protein HYX13_00790 [Candidatus Woesearchaeota archaeon]|nr:hypothetical protein [Candidatus Woesearchaeota archaeon]
MTEDKPLTITLRANARDSINRLAEILQTEPKTILAELMVLGKYLQKVYNGLLKDAD